MNKQIVGARVRFFASSIPHRHWLAGYRSRHARIRSDDRWGNPERRSNKRPALRCRKKASRRGSIRDLLERL